MFFSVLVYSALAGVATMAGTLLILHRYKWAKHNSMHLMSFAAGIMLALAFLHLIPEAIHMTGEGAVRLEEADHEGEGHVAEAEHRGEGQLAFIVVLLGLALFHAVESIIVIHPRHDVEAEDAHRHGRLSLLSIVGLTFHSAIDGIIIAVGFRADFQIGMMTTIAVILHETPEGVVTASILLHDTMERAKILWFSLLVAVATPIAAVVSYLVLGDASANFLGALLALAAGSLIYIAAADLIPETHKEEKRLNTAVLVAGMVVLYFNGRLMGHGH